MRGDDIQQGAMFSYLSPEQRVPADHPLRPIRQMVDTVLKRLSPRFEAMYAEGGRPSIPPEKLLRALLLQCLYSVRSERLLMEQLDYNLLFRWFVGLNMDDPIWDFTVFSKNRERLLEADVARAFFAEVGQLAREQGLLSDEHFTVDGTLIEAWAGQKSFKPRAGTPPPTDSDAGNPSVNFRGQTPQQRHARFHHRSGRPVVQEGERAGGEIGFSRPRADGEPQRPGGGDAADQGDGNRRARGALEMVGAKRQRKRGRLTLGGDKNYDTSEHVASLRELKVAPHVAQNTRRPGGSAIDQRTTRHAGYAVSQTKRKRVEEIFGWFKTVALMRKTRFRGLQRVGWMFTWAAAAYNLVRMRNLLGATT